MTLTLRRGEPDYPPRLASLGAEAPDVLTALGDPSLLRLPAVAFFSSVRTAGEAALSAYDLARALRDAGIPTIGGFQSPVERECLDFLLRGRQPVVVCPARSIEGLRLRAAWRTPVREGRMLLLSPFPAPLRRPTAGMADTRNRLVAALADRILVVHATAGGRLHRLAAEALRSGKRVLCADLATNHDLLVLGAEPIDPSASHLPASLTVVGPS